MFGRGKHKNELQTKLEEIKQLCHYSVNMFYGGDVGADDLDISPSERSIRVYAVPVGVLGGARACWSATTMDDFLKMDISAPPKILSNPPTMNDLSNPGRYVWGTDDSLEALRKNEYFTSEGYQLGRK